MSNSIIIAGGGLAGLTVATRLHDAGLAFTLLEARDRLGGRILSADHTGAPSHDGFDLGPSWFWPAMQPQLAGFIHALGLTAFGQHSEGDLIIQRSPREAPMRYRGLRQEPSSMRLAGGARSLIAALAARLPPSTIRTGACVTKVALEDDGAIVTFTANGEQRMSRASAIVLAMPPRLIDARIAFAPDMQPSTRALWRDTPTWMAPHAKAFALYKTPFWREAGLSGQAQSAVGPLVEIHDATTASGRAALFGFVGVPAQARAEAGREAVIDAIVAQLGQMFGPQGGKPEAVLYKDWAADEFTATGDDLQASGHPAPRREAWIDAVWRDRLWFAGSETSLTEPGYLAGAVEAGLRIADDLIARRAQG